MMRQIKYEFERTFFRLSTLTVLAVILVLNGFITYRANKMVTLNSGLTINLLTVSEYSAEYALDDGTLDVKRIIDRYEELETALFSFDEYEGPVSMDYTEYQEALREYYSLGYLKMRNSELSDYDEYLESIADLSHDLVDDYANEEHAEFTLRNVEDIEYRYGKLHGVKPVLTSSLATEYALGGWVSTACLVIASVFVCMLLFYSDVQDRTSQLIRTTENGGTALYLSKLTVLTAFIPLYEVLLFGSNLLAGCVLFSPADWDSPVQVLRGFITCPWRISQFEYVLLYFAVKWVGTLLLSLGCSFSFVIGESLFYSLLTFGAMFCAQLLLYKGISYTSPLLFVKEAGAFPLLDTNELLRDYLNVNVLGFPCNTLMYSIFCAATAIVLLAVLGNILWCGIKDGETVRIKSAGKKTELKNSIFGYELYKVFNVCRGLAALIIVLAVQTFTVSNSRIIVSDWEQYYLAYSEKVQGKVCEENYKRLLTVQQDIMTSSERIEEYSEMETRGEITEDEARKLIYEASFSAAKIEGFYKALAQYEYLLETGDPDAEYIITTPYDKLFDKGQILTGFVAFWSALIICVPSVLSLSRDNDMELLENSVVNTRRCKRLNFISACIYILCSFAVSFLPYYVKVCNVMGLSGMTAPSYCLPRFAGLSGCVSVAGAIILCFATRLVIVLAAYVFMYVLSRKNSSRPLLSAAGIILASLCLSGYYYR